ncbi:hypothetical protein [Rhizobium sp. 007]|uniref:hypothetical protein n=1 Tax=Rhizobium sp. 007 TaxID=2785056 RepID=UPI00188F4E03|nr:hypothetical protein [Rhizobium sp. 007]QPB21125.1 hypothetical protein ISN39_06560 [Rhizobium sp. 007]
MKTKVETGISRLFQHRKRFWAVQGYRGRGLYRQLAEDLELPADCDEQDAAAILGVKPETMKARRRRRQPPSFTRRHGAKGVIYELSSLCDLLATGTVETPRIETLPAAE